VMYGPGAGTESLLRLRGARPQISVIQRFRT
jgi:hypothetical protein